MSTRALIAGDVAALNLNGVDLHDYDVVLVNSSAGKDSQATLSYVVALADLQGYPRRRIVVVHADLGRIEWAGTRELAERQAAAYGLRFEVVARDEDLLEQIRTRRRTLDAQARQAAEDGDLLELAGYPNLAQIAYDEAAARWHTPAWPSAAARYCTSDQKTGQVAKLMTRLAAEHRTATAGDPVQRAVRILNCLGLRAQEGPERAKKTPFGPDSKATNGRREVTRWLPIFTWSGAEVWETIRASGLPWHEAYDLGMPRLSCVFCVLAGERELTLAAKHNPALAAEYLAVEAEVRHTFREDLSMAQIVERAGLELAA